jgi:hypothetical protein
MHREGQQGKTPWGRQWLEEAVGARVDQMVAAARVGQADIGGAMGATAGVVAKVATVGVEAAAVGRAIVGIDGSQRLSCSCGRLEPHT